MSSSYVADHPNVPARQELFEPLIQCKDIHIPLIYNGDIYCHQDIVRFREKYPNVSLMIGRGALINVSLFKDTQKTVDEVIKDYLLISARNLNRFSNTKYPI